MNQKLESDLSISRDTGQFLPQCALTTPFWAQCVFPLFRVNAATGVAVCLFVPGLGVASLVKKERKTENGKI